MKYIPLNIKTEFDLMNSLIKIDELILYEKTIQRGQCADACTFRFVRFDFFEHGFSNFHSSDFYKGSQIFKVYIF